MHLFRSLPPHLLAASIVASAGFVVDAAPAESLLDMIAAQAQSAPTTAPAEPAPSPETAAAAMPGYVSDRATFLISRDRIHSDPELLWPGFLNGLRGFEHFYEPVGNPLYFESPFNSSGLRLLYLWHRFPKGSQLGGGDLSVFAAQVRLALSERLAFIATKDGYSVLNAGILPPDEGWNDFAIGLKYLLIVDRENDFVLTTGMRWEWVNGDNEVLQGGTHELSPFISFAKGWDQFHLLGNVTGRLPMDSNDGNYILSWDLHADYEIAPEALPGFAPMIEVHGLHYLSNGERLPLSVGGLDYSNIGSSSVAGDSVFWAGIGGRWKLTPHWSIGSTWEFPLHDPNNDIMGNRVTVDMHLTW